MNNFTAKQAKDIALSLSLVILGLVWFSGNTRLVSVPALLMALAVFFPSFLRIIFYPFYLLIFKILGPLLSFLFLIFIYFMVITPVGFLRRKAGVDTYMLKRWKKDDGSVFTEKKNLLEPKDLSKPY